MASPPVAPAIGELRRQIAAWRAGGARIGLIPTMGALHEGHLSLVRAIQARREKAVVSIFVNPTQFGPGEDFERYPRTFESDCAKLSGIADLVFAPSVKEMYPEGFATKIEMGGPALGLETDFRPHFFAGVATVVAKLLIAAMPDTAIFGEKDYQQLMVIKRLNTDLGLPIEIIGGAIVREADGLAMSSRNAYLSAGERKVAGQMNVILQAVAARVRKGDEIAACEEAGKKSLLNAGFGTVDYVAVRDAETLGPVTSLSRRARVLVAAKIGGTRLIDNMAV